jgi:hypothetical protein
VKLLPGAANKRPPSEKSGRLADQTLSRKPSALARRWHGAETRDYFFLRAWSLAHRIVGEESEMEFNCAEAVSPARSIHCARATNCVFSKLWE